MTEPKFAAIGARLAWVRSFRPMTRQDYAAQHGIDRSLYSQFEIGHRCIPVWAATEIANKQRVTLDFIYQGAVPGLPEVWKARLLDDPRSSELLLPSDTD